MTVIETATTVAVAPDLVVAKGGRGVVNLVPVVARAAPVGPKVRRVVSNGRSDRLALRMTPTGPPSRGRSDRLVVQVPNAVLAPSDPEPSDPEPSDRLEARPRVAVNVLRDR